MTAINKNIPNKETTACEKPLFTFEVFVFEHFFYSVLYL